MSASPSPPAAPRDPALVRSTVAVVLLVVVASSFDALVPVNAVVLALVGGILVTNLSRGAVVLAPAVGDLLLKRVLKAAIVLLGATVDLRSVTELGPRAGIAILVAITVALVVAVPLGRVAGLGRRTAALVGVGCAICGASAIAAVAPVLGARREEIGLALGTIFTLNALALLSLGAVGAWVGLDAAAMGAWAGVAVHDTASAVALGFASGPEAGEVATLVKLSRTVALVPLVAVVAVSVARTAARSVATGAAGSSTAAPPPSALRAALASFPWFVAGFVALSIAGTFLLPDVVRSVAGRVAGIAIVAVVAGIGLSLRWSRLVAVGTRTLLVGLVASLAVASATLAVLAAA